MMSKRSRIETARFFTALGHPRRLLICDILRRRGPEGLQFDLLSQQCRLSPSTLAHHLGQMDRGGILVRKVKGRETWLSLNEARIGRTLGGAGPSRSAA